MSWFYCSYLLHASVCIKYSGRDVLNFPLVLLTALFPSLITKSISNHSNVLVLLFISIACFCLHLISGKRWCSMFPWVFLRHSRAPLVFGIPWFMRWYVEFGDKYRKMGSFFTPHSHKASCWCTCKVLIVRPFCMVLRPVS